MSGGREGPKRLELRIGKGTTSAHRVDLIVGAAARFQSGAVCRHAILAAVFEAGSDQDELLLDWTQRRPR